MTEQASGPIGLPDLPKTQDELAKVMNGVAAMVAANVEPAVRQVGTYAGQARLLPNTADMGAALHSIQAALIALADTLAEQVAVATNPPSIEDFTITDGVVKVTDA